MVIVIIIVVVVIEVVAMGMYLGIIPYGHQCDIILIGIKYSCRC